MATLTAQEIVEAGLEATYDAATGGGDDFLNSGREMIHVKNGSGSEITVTVTAQKTTLAKGGYGTLTKSNSVVAITAAEDRFIGPFPITAFNDPNGKAQITYSDVTSLTLAVIKGAGLSAV
ncbi:MAG: hypothetical protein KAJ19_21790 [Gammaproteobacteria bacterium]|nr:hypothetical protein [Gammaproteobacteria bacterium]